MFFSRGLIGANSRGESSVEVSASTLLLDRASNQYLDCGNDSSLQPLVGITLSIWFNTTDMTAGTNKYNALITRRDASNTDWQMTHILANNDSGGAYVHRIRFDQNGSQIHNSTSLSTTNTWYHIAVTYDEANVKIYIDGSLDNTTANTNALTANANKVVLGSDNSGSPFYMKGSINHAGIYNRALTASEIGVLYNNGTPKQPWLLPPDIKDDAVLLLPLNDQTNSNQYSDYSGNANDATASGSPTLTGTSLTIINSSDKGP